ncbi:hypothetical protein [Streptomyces sp. MNU76]|uniref:hypothetical protein n=1 Tax=Streptomyces sp. MNU76 TaxID=2560026 RepID=UPI0027DF9631|nr:hypothetical protein [Streptomyces sp. MNU76]
MPTHQQRRITDEQFHEATLILDYQRMGRELRPCSAAVGPGSRDLGVARRAAGERDRIASADFGRAV